MSFIELAVETVVLILHRNHLENLSTSRFLPPPSLRDSDLVGLARGLKIFVSRKLSSETNAADPGTTPSSPGLNIDETLTTSSATEDKKETPQLNKGNRKPSFIIMISWRLKEKSSVGIHRGWRREIAGTRRNKAGSWPLTCIPSSCLPQRTK